MASNTHPGQRRQACERCRKQKLKCLRQSSDRADAACARCIRLQVTCQGGTQGRIGRPSRAEKSAAPLTARLDASTTSGLGCSVTTTAHPLIPQSGERTANSLAVDILQTSEDMCTDWIGDSLSWDLASPLADIGRGISAQALLITSHETASSQSLSTEMGQSSYSYDREESQREFLKALSKIHVDFHSCRERIQICRLDGLPVFSSIICRDDSQPDQSVAVAEAALVSAREFLGVLTRLHDQFASRNIRRDADSFQSSLTLPAEVSLDPALIRVAASGEGFEQFITPDMDEPSLGISLALVVIGCYVQLVEVLEIVFISVRRRLQTLHDEPFEPIQGLSFGALQLDDGLLQAKVFFEIVSHTLSKTERLLGVNFENPRHGEMSINMDGLLSHPRHFALLQATLESSQNGLVSRPILLWEAIKSARQMVLDSVTC
jgi:hypothetical protein